MKVGETGRGMRSSGMWLRCVKWWLKGGVVRVDESAKS